ncbi:MAG TPA: protein-glutamate O-methyltransferase CheR [Pseudolabrys sp.]|jgi:chemotaxis protein methyltransferase CheR
MFRKAPGGATALAASEPLVAPPREFDFSDDDFRALIKLAYEHAGIALSESKRNLVYSRLSRRLRTLKMGSFREYREFLLSEASEIENFINSISTNHTKFFREDHHFDHFRARVAVPFSQSVGSAGRASLRVWSAGCSSGEEPYTISVVLKRELRSFINRDVKILATDIDTDVLNRASRGEFAPNTIDDVPKPYLSFFKHATIDGKEKVVIDDDLRSIIAFRRLNLMDPWPFRGLFDAIFCRNVMIYFDGPTKANLIERFANQIKPGGWLYIGHSESLTGTHPQLRAVGRTIYRRSE